jgi:hypothetical protein
MGETCDYHHGLLIFSAKNLRMLNMKVLKMKSIYCSLNMLRVTPNSLIARCWVPVCKLQLVTSALVRATVSMRFFYCVYWLPTFMSLSPFCVELGSFGL